MRKETLASVFEMLASESPANADILDFCLAAHCGDYFLAWDCVQENGLNANGDFDPYKLEKYFVESGLIRGQAHG